VEQLSDDDGYNGHDGECGYGSDEGEEFSGFHGEESGDEECFVAYFGDEYEGEGLVEAGGRDFVGEE